MLKIHSEFDAERVKKFGTLVDKKKYAAMTKLAQLILTLLNENSQPTKGALFKNFEQLRVKMISVNPARITPELLSSHQ